MPEGESTKLLTEDPLVINKILTRAQYLYATFNWTQKLGSARCLKAENLIELIKKNIIWNSLITQTHKWFCVMEA